MNINEINKLSELRVWLELNKISLDEIVLVGSASLAAYGVRRNNDLEVAILPRVLRRSGLVTNCSLRWHSEVAPECEIYKNQLIKIGFTDKRLFRDKTLTRSVDGIKIIKIEIEFLYKTSLSRDKDLNDIFEIKKIYPNIEESSKYFRMKENRIVIVIYGLYMYLSRIIRLVRRIMNI